MIDKWQVTFAHNRQALDLTVDQGASQVYFVRVRYPKPLSYSIWASDLNDLSSSKTVELVPESKNRIHTIDMDPAGGGFYYTQSESADGPFSVFRYDLATTRSTRVVGPHSSNLSPNRAAIHPDGSHLYYSRNTGINEQDGIWSLPLVAGAESEQIVKAPGSFPFEVECRQLPFNRTRVCWADINRDGVFSVTPNGRCKRVLLDARGDSADPGLAGLEFVTEERK